MTDTDRNRMKNKKNTDGSDVMKLYEMPAKTWYWLGVNSSELSWNNTKEDLLGEYIITAEEGQKYPDSFFTFTDAKALYNNKKFTIDAKADSEVLLVVNVDIPNNLRVYFLFPNFFKIRAAKTPAFCC